MSFISTLPKELRDLLQHYIYRENWQKLSNLCKNLFSYDHTFTVYGGYEDIMNTIKHATNTNLNILNECNVKYTYAEDMKTSSIINC